MAIEKDTENLQKTIEKLKKENTNLKSRPRGRFGYLFIVVGFILFSLAIDFENYMLSFFSIAFLFLGGLFLYLSPNNYVRQEILTSTLVEIDSSINELVHALEYFGLVIYKSPETLTGFSDVHAYILKNELEIDLQNELQWTGTEIINSQRLKTKPIGLGLVKLMERESKINFASLDVEQSFIVIEKMLVENLELIKNLKITKMDNNINIKIRYIETMIKDINSKIEKDSYQDYIISSITCSITKSTHKPVLIKNIIRDKNNIDEITLQIL